MSEGSARVENVGGQRVRTPAALMLSSARRQRGCSWNARTAAARACALLPPSMRTCASGSVPPPPLVAKSGTRIWPAAASSASSTAAWCAKTSSLRPAHGLCFLHFVLGSSANNFFLFRFPQQTWHCHTAA